MAFLQPNSMANSPSLPSAPTSSSSSQSFFSQRNRRQLGLFAAGAGFFAISSIITRRSLVRRYNLTVPKFYHPSNRANNEINGAMEAFEALNIATINVVSVGMMMTGGILYAFDISSIDDVRRNVRRRFGVPEDRSDQDVEKEIEEWFATVLERKGNKDKKGVEAVGSVLERIAEKEKNSRKVRDKEEKP